MDLSVVIPVKDEAANVASLVAEVRAALDGLLDYEILCVDDGSEDGTVTEVARLQAAAPHLRLLRHMRNYGQSAALRSGVKAARAVWIATLDGDGQNDPADIPKLWRMVLTAPVAPPLLIAGYRESRQDRWTKRFSSQIANRVRRRMLGDGSPDTGCGLKLFPRSLFLDLPYFDHMHRFLPALVLREGGIVRSIRVNHRARRGGISKYGVFDRLGVGVVDLCGVIWLKRRAARPHLLGEVLPDLKTASASPSISVVR